MARAAALHQSFTLRLADGTWQGENEGMGFFKRMSKRPVLIALLVLVVLFFSFSYGMKITGYRDRLIKWRYIQPGNYPMLEDEWDAIIVSKGHLYEFRPSPGIYDEYRSGDVWCVFGVPLYYTRYGDYPPFADEPQFRGVLGT
jgi:hypothetical protein